MDKWISAKERLPDFDKPVLVCYTLKGKEQYHTIIEIARLDIITRGKDFQSAEWKDSEGGICNPDWWMELPSPPKQ